MKGWGIRGESGRNGGGMGVGSSLNLGLKLGMQDQEDTLQSCGCGGRSL